MIHVPDQNPVRPYSRWDRARGWDTSWELRFRRHRWISWAPWSQRTISSNRSSLYSKGQRPVWFVLTLTEWRFLLRDHIQWTLNLLVFLAPGLIGKDIDPRGGSSWYSKGAFGLVISGQGREWPNAMNILLSLSLWIKVSPVLMLIWSYGPNWPLPVGGWGWGVLRRTEECDRGGSFTWDSSKVHGNRRIISTMFMERGE